MPDDDPKPQGGDGEPKPNDDPKPNGAGGAGTAGTGGDGGEGEPFDKDRAMETIRKQRESENALRKERDEIAKRLKDREDAELSEQDRLKKRAQELEVELKDKTARLERQTIDREIERLAVSRGFTDPTDAVALVDRSGIALDDGGSVNGVEHAVNELAKSKPHLVGGGEGNGNNGRSGPPPSPRNGSQTATKEQLEQAARDASKGQSRYQPY